MAERAGPCETSADEPASVDGAGAASAPALGVPACLSATQINVPVLEWVLGCGLAAGVAAMRENAGAASALEARLRSMHLHALGLSSCESDGRLHTLRVHGELVGATAVEQEYAALFAPQRQVRAAVLAAREATAAGVPVLAPTAGASLTPLDDVVRLLPLDASALHDGVQRCTDAAAASATRAAELHAAYLDAGRDADVADARLRALQVGGADVLVSVTASEAAYAQQVAPVRELRDAVYTALAPAAAAAAAAGVSPPSALCSIDDWRNRSSTRHWQT